MGIASRPPPSQLKVASAFLAVYLIWGSTYLAIRVAIETLPPFLMAGIRFLIAGAALYAWARVREGARPTRVQWRSASIVGGLLLLGGNGGVVWAEQTVASGLTAVLIATVPLWIALFEWLRGGIRPGRRAAVGLPIGFAGVALLVAPTTFADGGRIDPTGVAVLMFASASWAAGSLYSRRASLPPSPILATAMQMLAGGALLLVAGSVANEWSRLDLAAVSVRSAISLVYLVLFGSLVGFTAYIWLLRVRPPAQVATYAYVNPLVAVVLGWATVGEPVTVRTMAAMAVILAAVALITTRRAGAAGDAGRTTSDARRSSEADPRR